MGLWPNFLSGGFLGRALLRPARGLALAVGFVATAGCVGQLPLEEMPEPATAAAHQGVDWSRAKPARIIITEFIFAHGEPSFKKGVPYRLELRNTGEETHMFEARAFFRSIAVRDVEIVETASIGGLHDPNRAWKPAPERLPEVGPEEEDEAEGKDGKAGKGKKGGKAKKGAKKGEKAAGKAEDDGAALKIDDDDLKEDEADQDAKDDGKDESDEAADNDDEAAKDDGDALKIDDADLDEDEADQDAKDESGEAAKDDDALVLKTDDDEAEADESGKDDDALVLKTDDDDEAEADESGKDDDALVLKTDDDKSEADESEADKSEARQAGATQVAKAAPVIKLPSQGTSDEDDDLTFERTPSQASDLGPVAKDEDEKDDAGADAEKGEEAKEGEAAAPQPPQPWTAITVEYVLVPPGHSAFVSFVPVREGSYWLSSGNPVFLTQGMFDRLVIE